MRNILSILLVSGLLFGCGGENTNTENQNKVEIKKDKIEVSFNKLYQSGNIIVCYTNDTDSLWLEEEWYNEVKRKMSTLKGGNLCVLLFDSKENTPNINILGFDYPTYFDKYMVCGYWRFNYEKFCYGGMKEDGNFNKCDEK